MGFAGKYNLDGLQGMQKKAFQAIQVVENKVGSFVAGESARESYSENLGIEQSSKCDYAFGANTFLGPLLAGPFVNIREQQSFQAFAQAPQFLVWNIVDGLPRFRAILLADPSGADIFIEHRLQPYRIHPGAQVHSVGYRSDRYVCFAFIGPQWGPHVARNFTVLLAYSIAKPGHAQREYSHVESSIWIDGIGAQRKEHLTVSPQLVIRVAEVFVHQWIWKYVGPGGNRGVRGEDGTVTNLREGLVESFSGFDQHAHTLDQSEGWMAFINMDSPRANS